MLHRMSSRVIDMKNRLNYFIGGIKTLNYNKDSISYNLWLIY